MAGEAYMKLFNLLLISLYSISALGMDLPAYKERKERTFLNKVTVCSITKDDLEGMSQQIINRSLIAAALFSKNETLQLLVTKADLESIEAQFALVIARLKKNDTIVASLKGVRRMPFGEAVYWATELKRLDVVLCICECLSSAPDFFKNDIIQLALVHAEYYGLTDIEDILKSVVEPLSSTDDKLLLAAAYIKPDLCKKILEKDGLEHPITTLLECIYKALENKSVDCYLIFAGYIKDNQLINEALFHLIEMPQETFTLIHGSALAGLINVASNSSVCALYFRARDLQHPASRIIRQFVHSAYRIPSTHPRVLEVIAEHKAMTTSDINQSSDNK